MKYAKKMKALEQLKKEATKRGIVEGATIRTAWPMHSTRTAIVPSSNEWILHGNKDLTFRDNGDDVWIKDLDSGRWAEIITPAPSKEEGLKENDACECGPAMRAAIVELARELGVDLTKAAQYEEHKMGLSWIAGKIHRWNYRDRHHIDNTPEVFIAKLRVTAALPKPIRIGSDVVKFNNGSIQVGCTTIENATVRLIASKLID